MVFLLVSGILVLCTGLLAVLFGIPIKEFSFGNTMILSGAVVACAGFVQIGLSFVVRELRQLARAVDTRTPAMTDVPTGRRSRDPRDAARRPPPARPAPDDMLFARDGSPGFDHVDNDDASYDGRTPPAISMPPLPPSAPLPESPNLGEWSDEPSAPPPLPPSVTPDRPRRDVMFTSRRRGEDDAQPQNQIIRSDDFSDPDRGNDSQDPFQDPWPPADRSRAPDAGRNGHAAPRPTPARRTETPPVTVVKSGVVDAMAYSLYSDGSIEAQTPEGMVRFGSINDLRAHLDQRG